MIASMPSPVRSVSAAVEPYLLVPPPIRRARGVPTAIDLFSGAGGLALGLSNAGFDVRLCSDFNEACERTHRRNFPRMPFLREDLAAVSGADLLRLAGLECGELDLLVGGPPCQGFSIIGRRDADDPRNRLFREFMRVASETRPRVLVMENVPGLATLDRGSVLAAIGEAFDRAGYVADCAELLSAQYGVPQMRWRVIFIGWRRDQARSGGFPSPTHGRLGIGALVPNRTVTAVEQRGFLTTADAISDLPPIGSGESRADYVARPKTAYQRAMRHGAPDELANHYAPSLSETNLKRIRHLRPGEDWRALPQELLPAGMRRALRKDHTRRFRRMTWDGVPRSIITRFRDPKSGEYTHPDQDRTISIREAARIQSFPDWFVFEGGVCDQYLQVGNAVPPLMARALGERIQQILNDGTGRAVSILNSRYRLVPSQSQNSADGRDAMLVRSVRSGFRLGRA